MCVSAVVATISLKQEGCGFKSPIQPGPFHVLLSAWMLSKHSGFLPHAVSGLRFTGGSELPRKRQRKANAAATKTLTWMVLQTSSNRL